MPTERQIIDHYLKIAKQTRKEEQMIAAKKQPTIIEQFDYISINFGNNRRLTAGRSGEKAAGAVPLEVFNEFCRRLHEKDETKGNFLVRIRKFVDEIDSIWPEWNKPPRKFELGEEVTADFGKRRGGVDKGIVTKVRGTNVTVRWERGGLIGMAADLLEERLAEVSSK